MDDARFFDAETRKVLDGVLAGSSVRITGPRLSGRTTIASRVAGSLEAAGWVVHRVTGDRALRSVTFAALVTSLGASIPAGVGVAGVAEALVDRIQRSGRCAIVSDDSGFLDPLSLAALDLAQRRTGVPLVTTVDAGGLLDERSPVSYDRWPEIVVTVPSLRYAEVYAALVQILEGPVDAAVVGHIRMKAAGRVGLVRRIAEAAARNGQLSLDDGRWTMKGTSLWTEDLSPTVEGLLLGLRADEMTALTHIARHGAIPPSSDPAVLRLIARGMLQSIPGVDPARHVTIVPPVIASYLLSRGGGSAETGLQEDGQYESEDGLGELLASLRRESDAEPAATARYFTRRCATRERTAFARWEADPSARNAASWLNAWWETPGPKRDPRRVLAATRRDGVGRELLNLALAESMWNAANGVVGEAVFRPLESLAADRPDWSSDIAALRLLFEGSGGLDLNSRERMARLAADPEPSSTVATVLALFDVYALEPAKAAARLASVDEPIVIPALTGFVEALSLYACGRMDDALVLALRARSSARRNADSIGYLMASYVAAISLIYRGQFDDAMRVIDGALALGKPGFLVNMLHDAMVRLSAVADFDVYDSRHSLRPSTGSVTFGPLPGVGTAIYELLSKRTESDAEFDTAVADRIEEHVRRGFSLEAAAGGLLCLCLRPGPKALQRLAALFLAHGFTAHDRLLAIARTIVDGDGAAALDLVRDYEADGDEYQIGMLLRGGLTVMRAAGRPSPQTQLLEEAVVLLASRFPGAGAHLDAGASRHVRNELTPREVQIAHLAGSIPNAEIATQLNISVRTVEHHVSNAMRKAGARSRQELGERVRGRLA
ncbi:putative LuxR family transcriptional regulator [Microbacterium sp. 8M]|uniref:helix-turn-helix transcriptional regulator n=1 Tax=Microbacterium sp. 8M TaxID=2653153 RepID=UPI0012F2B337|nr:LuxR C-terminal-related transcriptional regulator [Microbacterium sp. 8M]VXB00161.1 putative LuxR family transcriptional regulator [Microbacterium sp. 8M]